MNECPCHYCNNRAVGCHAECSKYIQLNEEHLALKGKIKEKQDLQRLLDSDTFAKRRKRK